MRDITLSLISPIYGVEKYIGEFLQSLEPNLIPGVEVIIVDDGTNDKSGLIADEFATEHSSFVRVIHKENGGAASARNLAMEVARGEYFIFPDPDDILEKNYTRIFLDAIEKYNHPDVLFCNFQNLIDGSLEKNLTHNFPKGMMASENYLKLFATDKIASMVWNKAIKKEVIGDIRFPHGVRIGEDTVFLTKVCLQAKTFAYLDEYLYIWRMRTGSTTRTMKFKDCLQIFSISSNRYNEYKKTVKDLSIVSPANYCYMALKDAYLNDIFGEDVVKCEGYMKNNLLTILFDKEVSCSTKRQSLFIILGIARKYIKSKYGD